MHGEVGQRQACAVSGTDGSSSERALEPSAQVNPNEIC